jgi:hypothetical protein
MCYFPRPWVNPNPWTHMYTISISLPFSIHELLCDESGLQRVLTGNPLSKKILFVSLWRLSHYCNITCAAEMILRRNQINKKISWLNIDSLITYCGKADELHFVNRPRFNVSWGPSHSGSNSIKTEFLAARAQNTRRNFRRHLYKTMRIAVQICKNFVTGELHYNLSIYSNCG